jgi:hypothetical protein
LTMTRGAEEIGNHPIAIGTQSQLHESLEERIIAEGDTFVVDVV